MGGIFGTLVGLFVVVVPIVYIGMILHEMFNPHKKCPHCAEKVRAEAKKCKHCGSDL